MFLFYRKNILKTIILVILSVILAYAVNISSIPESIILFQNQDFNFKTISGVKIGETIEVGSNISNVKNKVEEVQTKEYNVSILGFNIKTIKASIIPDTKVIPLGNLIGLKLYTKGLLVVGMSQIEGENNQIYKPYEECGIQQGDCIIKVNNKEVNNTDELLKSVSKSKGEKVYITYLRNGEEKNGTITPIKVSKNTYKLGLWVRDSAAGVGTATFYEATTNSCATLGHSIQDIDTGEIVEISTGEIVTSKIENIEKGEKDNPGKIEGNIEESSTIGTIYSNTEFGIYGNIINNKYFNLDNSKAIQVATRNEIKAGEASVLCALENGLVKEYEIQIQKVFKNNNENNKSMIVKVTDKELLEKTGGIIQGMSGSPVIQNGKFIGALTHVLVSDPTTGYAVFGDLMIKQMKNVE